MSIPYLDESLPADIRAKDLVLRMTLDQKIRQLTCIMVGEYLDDDMLKGGIGAVASYADFPTADERRSFHDNLQKKIMEYSGWGIPALFHAEGISGNISAECVVFPSPLAVGASFDTNLAEDIGKSVRNQMISVGIRQSLAPVLDIIRDFRWGRTNECYGSDPALVSEIGCAYIKGLQGDSLKKGIAATAKHFLGYSVGEGGLNIARSQTDSLDLRENFAKPFEAAIHETKLACIMSCYSEVNGRPVIASREILTELLRDDIGFEGVTVSDYMSIDMLEHAYHIARDKTEAGTLALEAGLDMELPRPYGFSSSLREAVKNGQISEKSVDRALLRVLKLKFELGLFESPFTESSGMDIKHDEEVSKRAAREGIVLLKNDGILPIENIDASIAVIGPTADSIRLLNGTYTRPATVKMVMEMGGKLNASMHGLESLVDTFEAAAAIEHDIPEIEDMVEETVREMCLGEKTILQAVKEIYPNTIYEKGCGISDLDTSGFEKAIRAASEADIVILALGGKNGWDSGSTGGEGNDSTDICLPGVQEKLALRVIEANPNTVIVHTDGKPLVSPLLHLRAASIVEAWLPGPYGGSAIADTILGKFNPGGKLPADVPRSVGQTPIYFGSHRPMRGKKRQGSLPGGYINEYSEPQYPFGYGLTYTSFEYGKAKIETNRKNDGVPVVSISCEVTNTGGRAGDEVVQLYGCDESASIIRPAKELVGFERVSLLPGQTKKVVFTFKLDRFAFEIKKGDWVLEEGSFKFYVGTNSSNIQKQLDFWLDNTIHINPRKRGLLTHVHID